MGILTKLTESYGFDVPDTSEETQFQFSEGVFGLFQVSADSEMAWNNIMVETLIKEHEGSVLEEGQILLDEAAKEFASKVIEWIKEKARKLKEYFRQLITRLRYAVMNVDKFLKVNKEYFKHDFFMADDMKTSLGEFWLSELGEITKDGEKYINNLSTYAKTLKSKEELLKKFNAKSVEEAIKAIEVKHVEKNDRNTRVIRITKKEMDEYVSELQSGQAKTSLSMISKAEKSCNEILSEMMKEAKGSADAEKIAFQKFCSSFADRVTGAYISLIFMRLSDSMKVCKLVVREAKKKGNRKVVAYDEAFN